MEISRRRIKFASAKYSRVVIPSIIMCGVLLALSPQISFAQDISMSEEPIQEHNWIEDACWTYLGLCNFCLMECIKNPRDCGSLRIPPIQLPFPLMPIVPIPSSINPYEKCAPFCDAANSNICMDATVPIGITESLYLE